MEHSWGAVVSAKTRDLTGVSSTQVPVYPCITWEMLKLVTLRGSLAG